MISRRYVGISISESDDMAVLGLGTAHLQDALVECARHLLHKGYGLVYGGDLAYDTDYNFSNLLMQLARTYSNGEGDRIVNYAAFPLSTKITEEMQAEIATFASVVPVIPERLTEQWKAVRYESATEDQIRELDRLFAGEDPESRDVWLESLTQMRELMTRQISARIVLGGKTKGFRGTMPGIIEETVMCVESNVPVIVDARFGGAAREILISLEGGKEDNVFHDRALLEKARARMLSLDDDVVAIQGQMPAGQLEEICSWLLL